MLTTTLCVCSTPWTRRDIIIYREEEGGKVTEKVYNAVSIRGLPPIRLVFMGNEHYDCVYQRGWCKRAGFCQGTHRRTYIRTYVHIRIRARVDCIVSGVVRSGTKQSSSDNRVLGLVLRDGAGCEGHVAIRSSCYATSCSVLYSRVKVLVVQS